MTAVLEGGASGNGAIPTVRLGPDAPDSGPGKRPSPAEPSALCYPCDRCGRGCLVLAEVKVDKITRRLCYGCTKGRPVTRFVRGEK